MKKKETLKVVNSRIRAIATELEMTSDEFGQDILGVTGTTYRNKLSGSNSWTLTDLIKIHEASGHSFDYFFGLANY